MQAQTKPNTAACRINSSDEELIDTLTAISVVAKHLARKLQKLSAQEQEKTGGQVNENE